MTKEEFQIFLRQAYHIQELEKYILRPPQDIVSEHKPNG